MRTSITSVFAIAFCLFLSINVSAQDRFTLNRDSATKIIKDPRYDQKPLKCLYVLDDKQYYRRSIKKSWQLDTSNILDIKVLKGTESRSRYGKSGRNGAIIITTKKYAIAQYEKKLSAFSEDYKKYFETQKRYNPNDDGIMIYTVDDNMPVFKKNELIRELYNLPAASIKSVKLRVQQTCCGINRYVTITTRK